MRAGVIVVVACVASCQGGESGTPDATTDAAIDDVDACVGACDAPPRVPTEWVKDYPETLSVDAAVTVPGGFVVIGSTEALRFDDDGELTARVPMSEQWGIREVTTTVDGDVVLAVSTFGAKPATHVIRWDGQTLVVRWVKQVATKEYDLIPVGMADGSVVAIGAALDQTGGPIVVRLDAVGEGTTVEIPEAPPGIANRWFELADGTLSGIVTSDMCQRWIFDPVTLESTFAPIGDGTCSHAELQRTSGFETLEFVQGSGGANHLEIRDTAGALVASGDGIPLRLAYPGAMIRDGVIAGMSESGRIYVAHLDALELIEQMQVPFRPGGSWVGSVMASDGERTFVAWLDQVGTFDTILRVARVGELE